MSAASRIGMLTRQRHLHFVGIGGAGMERDRRSAGDWVSRSAVVTFTRARLPLVSKAWELSSSLGIIRAI